MGHVWFIRCICIKYRTVNAYTDIHVYTRTTQALNYRENGILIVGCIAGKPLAYCYCGGVGVVPGLPLSTISPVSAVSIARLRGGDLPAATAHHGPGTVPTARVFVGFVGLFGVAGCATPREDAGGFAGADKGEGVISHRRFWRHATVQCRP